jgi:hypothetical protein
LHTPSPIFVNAVVELLDGHALEVTAVSSEDGSGYRLALLIGEPVADPVEAQAVAEGFGDRLGEALTADLHGPLRVPSERLELPT